VLTAPPGKPFRLRNGSSSDVYVDHGMLLCRPDTNRALVDSLGYYVTQRFSARNPILSNVDSKSSPQLVGAIATAQHLRQIVVSPEATFLAERGPLRRLRLPVEIAPHDVIVVVDDVLTANDDTALLVVELIRQSLADRLGPADAATVEFHVVVALIRDAGAAPLRLERAGIEVHWLAELEQVLGEMRGAGEARKALGGPV
jgi:orotate phosphoribosyltransferase